MFGCGVQKHAAHHDQASKESWHLFVLLRPVEVFNTVLSIWRVRALVHRINFCYTPQKVHPPAGNDPVQTMQKPHEFCVLPGLHELCNQLS